MKKNVGKADKWVRVLIGAGILGVGYAQHSYWGFVGLVPIFTAFVNWCPLYVPFGISTCSIKKHD